MTWELDHLAVSCTDLAQGTAHVEQALGVRLQAGGQHLRFGTHNTLLGLEDGLYLEVIAADPSQPAPPVRWFALDGFDGPPRMGNWICRVPDLEAAIGLSPTAVGEPVDMVRGDLRWQIAVPDDGSLPLGGGWPTLITWGPGVVHPATRLTQAGVRLRRLTVLHPDAQSLRDRLAQQLPDDRIGFETAAVPGYVASFETPHGERLLT